jgi:outer membrane protein assembly factor BamB
MKKLFLAGVAGIALLINASGAAAASVLFGGIGGHNVSSGSGASANDGALAIIDQNTAAITIVGHPSGVARLSGLAFDSTGALFATTQPAGAFPEGSIGASNLLQLNPGNGAIIASVPITDRSIPINIADLAVQPATDLLFGVRGPNDTLGGQGDLYVINEATGTATLLGNTGHLFDSIAFAPDGTLYLASGDLSGVTTMSILNPANAATISAVFTADFFGALAVRSDGVIFGGNGDGGELFTIDPNTGAESLIGSTGLTFVGDLAFAPVPEPEGLFLFLVALGLTAILVRRRLRLQGT